MANFPTEIATELQILHESEGLGERGNAILRDLGKAGLYAAIGLTHNVAHQIQDTASQVGIREYCPNDVERFANPAKWAEKGRVMIGIYDGRDMEKGMLSSDQNPLGLDCEPLLAYGWFGPEAEGNDITTAYRVGDEARKMVKEKGCPVRFGRSLGELVLGVAIGLQGVAPQNITLEAWRSNEGALKLYERLGFKSGKIPGLPELRPTRQLPGTTVGGIPVSRVFDGARSSVVVPDTRLFYRLSEYPTKV